MPSALWYRMSSNLPADFQAMAGFFATPWASSSCVDAPLQEFLQFGGALRRALQRDGVPGSGDDAQGGARDARRPCRARSRRTSRRARPPSPAPAWRGARVRRGRAAGSRCRRRAAPPRAARHPVRGAGRASIRAAPAAAAACVAKSGLASHCRLKASMPSRSIVAASSRSAAARASRSACAGDAGRGADEGQCRDALRMAQRQRRARGARPSSSPRARSGRRRSRPGAPPARRPRGRGATPAAAAARRCRRGPAGPGRCSGGAAARSPPAARTRPCR